MFRTQAEARVSASLQGDDERAKRSKNYAITLMRDELEARRRRWQAWHWALGFAADAADPVITSDQAVGMWGTRQDQSAAFEDSDFWLWCPLSWDMCLIGCSKALTDTRARMLNSQQLSEIRSLTRAQAQRFVVSPIRLPDY
jgi:hypothetical protein